MVRESYPLRSDPPNISSAHLAPYTVITVSLTIFPVLHLVPPWLFCNHQSVLLNPFTGFTQPPGAPPLGNYQSVLSVCGSVSILFVSLFCASHSTCISEMLWCLSFSDWLISLSTILSRSIHAVAGSSQQPVRSTFYCAHFTDEKNKAQEGKGVCPRSCSWAVTHPGFKCSPIPMPLLFTCLWS